MAVSRAGRVVLTPSSLVGVVVRGISASVSLPQPGLLARHPELRRAKARTHDPLGPHRVSRNLKAPERRPDAVQGYAKVDERPENHVAGRTGEAVEVQRAHA